MDLFVVPTIGFNLLYAFVIIRLDRRDLVWIREAETTPNEITPDWRMTAVGGEADIPQSWIAKAPWLIHVSFSDVNT
jgi:hypothetical protein